MKLSPIYLEQLEAKKLEGRLEGKIEGKLEGKIEGKLEGKIEGKLETVPLLIQLGMTVEEIADRLNLPLEDVKKVIETNNN